MHRYTRTIITATFGCALLAWTMSLQAEQSSSPLVANPVQAAQATATAQGELIDVDSKARLLSIRTSTGAMEFRYDDDTKVTGAQKGVAGLATMTGTQVSITYRKDGTVNHALNIEVRAAAPAPRP